MLAAGAHRGRDDSRCGRSLSLKPDGVTLRYGRREPLRRRSDGRQPAGAAGTQFFFYRALEPAGYSRHGIGLQHLSFNVSSRATVHEAHPWALDHGAEIVREPRPFPEYGEHCYATYFLDPPGIMLEVVCQAAPADAQ